MQPTSFPEAQQLGSQSRGWSIRRRPPMLVAAFRCPPGTSNVRPDLSVHGPVALIPQRVRDPPAMAVASWHSVPREVRREGADNQKPSHTALTSCSGTPKRVVRRIPPCLWERRVRGQTSSEEVRQEGDRIREINLPIIVDIGSVLADGIAAGE